MKQLPRISLLPDSVLFYFFIFLKLSSSSIMREQRCDDDNPEDLSEEFSMCRQGLRLQGSKVLCISQRKPAAVFTLVLPLSCSLYNGDVKTCLDMKTIASILLRVIVLKKIYSFT